MKIKPFTRMMLFICMILAYGGCGGGTVGTGTGERSIEGRANYSDGRPIIDATITILETGESAQTDEAGTFALTDDSGLDRLSLEITAGTISSRVTVDVPEAAAEDVIKIDISLDPIKQIATVSNVSITAKIEGRCDPYFENKRTIRQSNRLASGTVCPVNVRVRDSEGPLARIPFVVQHAACDKKRWQEDARGVTNLSGFGTADFTYIDKPAYCYYRIIVPYNVKGIDPVTFTVVTFQAQK